MLAGPIDFTPGIFNITLEPYKEDNQVNTTIAKQLALYVVIYSPLQMAADLIDHYRGNPAFQFIRDVAVDWEENHVLNGEVGDYVTIARKEREGDRWFLGSISDENPREFTFTLDFLDPRQKYVANIYRDADEAHYRTNPTAITLETKLVDAETDLDVKLAPGGGYAAELVPVSAEEAEKYMD